MGVQYPSNSPGTVLFLKVIKKLEANVFKFLDYPKMSFVSQPGEGTPYAKEYDPENDWLLLLCKMLKDMMKALINDQIEEDERKKKQ
jgi:hypothetical protein